MSNLPNGMTNVEFRTHGNTNSEVFDQKTYDYFQAPEDRSTYNPIIIQPELPKENLTLSGDVSTNQLIVDPNL